MAELVIESDKEIQLRLPWAKICKLACDALINGVSLNALCERALEEYVLELKFQELCSQPGTTIADLATWADEHGCKVSFDLKGK